jgi:hypothetical protein
MKLVKVETNNNQVKVKFRGWGTAEDETQLKTKAHLITLNSGVINRMIWFKFSKVYSPLGNSPRVKSRVFGVGNI